MFNLSPRLLVCTLLAFCLLGMCTLHAADSLEILDPINLEPPHSSNGYEKTFEQPASYSVYDHEFQGDLTDLTYTYNLLLPDDDSFKRGFIFAGFRLQSQPETLWLLNGKGARWTVYDPEAGPVSYGSFRILQPVTPISFLIDPTDVSAYVGDGEFWVGYGFAEGASGPEVAFQDMLDNQNYFKVWRIGSERENYTHIELEVTGIKVSPPQSSISSE